MRSESKDIVYYQISVEKGSLIARQPAMFESVCILSSLDVGIVVKKTNNKKTPK